MCDKASTKYIENVQSNSQSKGNEKDKVGDDGFFDVIFTCDTPPPKTSFEDILESTGGFGLFQWIVLIVLLLPEIPAAFVAFTPVFAGKEPSSWTCTYGESNQTFTGSSSEICSCNGTISSNEHSIITEWTLICGQAWVSDFIISIQMLGMLIGSLFSSQMSDWYGRKKTYFGVCLLMISGQTLSAVSSSPYCYAVARFIAGAGLSGFMGMSTVYPIEFLTQKYRLLVGSFGPWGEGIMIFAILAYFIRPWRDFIWITILPFSFVILTIPFFPESPRWLLRHQKLEKAQTVLTRMAKINSVTEYYISTDTLDAVAYEENKGTNKTRFSYLSFFRKPDLRKKTLLLMGIWFSWSVVYYGLSFNIKNLRGDPYLNMFLMGLSDALGYPAALLINNRIGRRKSLIVFMTIGAAFLVALAILDLIYGISLSVLTVAILCLIGKFGVAGARSSARILTGESFPTPIRTMGYGITGVTAGIGGILSPQIAFIGEQWWRPLPFVTFAFISVTGSALSLMLSETAGKSLQEEIDPTKVTISPGKTGSPFPSQGRFNQNPKGGLS